VRDAQGNVMSIYKYENNPPLQSFAQVEKDIYGSSRLGVDKTITEMIGAPPVDTTIFTRILGNKNYDGTNHLGNVLSTFTDRKFPVSNDGTTVDHYVPEVVSANDYYPFGVKMKARSFNSTNNRYQFNGKEFDDETETTDYGNRVEDGDLGGFLSVDPIARNYPWYTPYQFAGNKPIFAVDLDGLEEKIAIYKINKDGSVALVKVINNVTVSDQTIKTPKGEEKLLWNISKNRLADGNDIGSTQYKYFQETTDGTLVETQKERNYAGDLIQRVGKENAIIPDYTNNFNLSLDFDKKGSTYIGNKNPTVSVKGTIEEQADYRREPVDLVDAAAMQHDKDYDAVKAKGVEGAFFDLRTINADLKLIKAAQNVIDAAAKGQIDPYTNKKISHATVVRAKNVILGFSIIAGQKLGRIAKGEKIETVPK
jgi:RHS repeat-associated protein